MKTIRDISAFEELSEKYSTWIIKYCSSTFEQPKFMIWYRKSDENETEHILSYKNGDIFTIENLDELKSKLTSERNDLEIIENITTWSLNFSQLNVAESCTYDLYSVINNLKQNIFDTVTIERIADFINLFDDFINQDERNNHFQKYIDDELVKEVWEYYYDFIFWPNFNEKEKSWNRPEIDIDVKELLIKIKDIIINFESKFRH